MKILVVSSGNIVQLAKYPRHFARQGHECVFINPAWSNVLSGRDLEDEFGGLNVRFYTWEDFERGIWQEGFDCIFGTQHGAAEKVLQWQKALGIPALLQILDIADEGFPELLDKQRPLIATYPEITRLTGINPAVPTQVSKVAGRDDCQCVFYPVDTELYDSVSDQETEEFVFIVSRHAEYKRVDLAIKACVHAGKKLVLAGGTASGKLLEFARNKGADTLFLGTISDKYKAKLMKRCKMHIFTQMWAEAPCIPSAEALYCGKPSVIWDYPAQRAIEGGYSVYVEPGDWRAMGEEIKRVFDNYDSAVALAKRGHDWVKKNLAPDVVAEQVLDMLEEMRNAHVTA